LIIFFLLPVQRYLAITSEDVAQVALIRREELDGFVGGIFGTVKRLDLPERAHCRVEILGEVRSFFVAMQKLTVDAGKPQTSVDLVGISGSVRKLTQVAEREIHEVVLSCTRGRCQILNVMSAMKPTVH